MYISLNEEKIFLDFKPYPLVKVSGPDDYYYVELREYVKNSDTSKYVEGYEITGKQNLRWKKEFECFVEFYGDFEISVYKFIDGYGIRRIFTHRYCDYGKYVNFVLDTDDEEECELWVKRVKEYQNKTGCLPNIETKFDHINKRFNTYYKTQGIEFYNSYRIGRYPKNSTDFRTVDPRKEGLIWLGMWKTFWSYQHPRLFKFLSSKEIADDILGLSE